MDHAATDRVEAFGVRFDNVSFDGAADRMIAMAGDPTPQYAVTPNVDHVVLIRRDAEMREIYRRADMVLCDGMPVKWAMRWLGTPLKEKVSGSDLLPALCRLAAERGLRVFLLGGGPGVPEECARRMVAENPGLDVAGVLSPPWSFDEEPESESEVVETVAAARPDILFAALGTPRQEKFIYRNLDALGVPMSIGVGAAFDFVAGTAKRAPRWMRRCGLEWFWRLIHEPRRLYRRYLIRDPIFFLYVWREWRERRRRRRTADTR